MPLPCQSVSCAMFSSILLKDPLSGFRLAEHFDSKYFKTIKYTITFSYLFLIFKHEKSRNFKNLLSGIQKTWLVTNQNVIITKKLKHQVVSIHELHM